MFTLNERIIIVITEIERRLLLPNIPLTYARILSNTLKGCQGAEVPRGLVLVGD